jgi:hypothetical protein
MSNQDVLAALNAIKAQMELMHQEQHRAREETASIRTSYETLRSDFNEFQQLMLRSQSRGSGSSRSSTGGLRLLCPMGCEKSPGIPVTFAAAHSLQDHLNRAVGICGRAQQASNPGARINLTATIPSHPHTCEQDANSACRMHITELCGWRYIQGMMPTTSWSRT